VTDVVGGVATPIVRALEPVTAPVTDALEPVLTPVVGVVAPVGEGLAPVVEPLRPIVEPIAPVPGVLAPELPVQPSAPDGPSTVVPAEQAAGTGSTYPGALQAPGAVAVVVWTSAGVQHAMLDLMREDVREGATASDAVPALSIATAGTTHAGGPGLLGADLPLGAGGAGNAAGASTAGLLGGGAQQLKGPGGEPLAALSALLLFRARCWRVATDESRAKLSSSYTDIPVSPA
jgi:hypothetical protein